MKTRVGIIATFLMFTTAPFALAQRGGGVNSSNAGIGHTGHDSTMVDSQRDPRMQVTDVQREAFSNCMTASKAVRKLVGRMPQDASYWKGRPRGYDFSAVSGKKGELQLALTDMTTAHQQFLQSLSKDQDTELGPNLSKLEHLQADLNLHLSQLDEELIAARPNSFSVAANVRGIGKMINKWRSEHKRIAKKMSISKL